VACSRTRLSSIILGVLLLTILFSSARVEAAEDTWSKSYGGPDSDTILSLQQTNDGGYVAAGITDSFGVGDEFWVLKLESDGSVEWEKAYGGSSDDRLFSIQQTPDGGYIATGGTESFGADSQDVWVVKLDSAGEVDWQKRYGGGSQETGLLIALTSDGGYVVIAETYSFGSGSNDAWVFKLDSEGEVEWENAYGGSNSDFLLSIQQTADGGYIAGGLKDSEGGWILKLESDGSVEWEKIYGFDQAWSVQQTPDGGYIVAGDLFDDGQRLWVSKLDPDGEIAWQKTFAYGTEPLVRLSSDGGYIVAANTRHFDLGNANIWVIKLDSLGGVEWQKAYGGDNQDQIARTAAIQETSGGGYVLGATTHLGDEQNLDFWVLKLDSNGEIADCNPGLRDTDALIEEGDASVADTTATIEQSDATVAVTESVVTETDALTGDMCALSADRIDLFENFDETSDGLIEPGTSVRAVAVTDDSSVTEVTFKWYDPGANLVREITAPVSSPEDTFTPDERGTWRIEADFGDGQVVTETVDVSFFVLPESPIGAAALVISSLAVLGGFMILKKRSNSSDLPM